MNMSSGFEPRVGVKSAALPWSCLTLLMSVVLLVIVLKSYKWELNWKVGVWLLIIYSAFVVMATFLEYNYCNTGLNLFAYVMPAPKRHPTKDISELSQSIIAHGIRANKTNKL